MISLFDMFKIGIGPSSSHTMGPMVAAGRFIEDIKSQFNDDLSTIKRIQVDLYGSLAATGRGHATDTACMLGLLGFKADSIQTTKVPDYLAPIFNYKRLNLNQMQVIDFDYDTDIIWHIQTNLPHHPNGLSFSAYTLDNRQLTKTYYSIGGGFIATENEFVSNPILPQPCPVVENHNIVTDNKHPKFDEVADNVAITNDSNVPYPFANAAQLIAQCDNNHLSICEVMMANEMTFRDHDSITQYLDKIWSVMQQCVINGCQSEGTLPGGLNVKRRAKALYQQLLIEDQAPINHSDKLMAMDWVDLYALAVNEENANGGRIVTAPTNGAAGIIPAVMHYYRDFIQSYSQQGARNFLLTAAAIGTIIKQNASISGAEVGCQGEVGSACAMAAAGLATVLGLSPAQCANAAEIGIEHNLGLTCDPIGGLVQVPCIERNAMAAVKAINAARLAKRGDGTHLVSLDNAIATMKATGADMMDKYKETAMGGLAVQVFADTMNLGDDTTFDTHSSNKINMVEVPVGYPQC